MRFFSLYGISKKTGVLFSFSSFAFFLHIHLFAFYHDINGDHIHTVRQAREGKDGRVLGRVCSLHLVILLIFFLPFLSILLLRSCIIMSPFFLVACALGAGGINSCCNFYS